MSPACVLNLTLLRPHSSRVIPYPDMTTLNNSTTTVPVTTTTWSKSQACILMTIHTAGKKLGDVRLPSGQVLSTSATAIMMPPIRELKLKHPASDAKQCRRRNGLQLVCSSSSCLSSMKLSRTESMLRMLYQGIAMTAVQQIRRGGSMIVAINGLTIQLKSSSIMAIF